jgi:tight adherence protein B
MNPTVVSIAAFLGITGLVAALMLLLRGKDANQIEDRLDVLSGKKAAVKDKEQQKVTKEALMKEGLEGLSGMANRLFERFDNLRLLFVQADTKLKPETFFLLSGGFAALGLGISFLARSPLPLYPVTALFLSSFPLMWLLWRRKRRFKRFGAQLPDAMELIARALRSGHSLASGLHVVVQEMPDPISQEFNMAYEEQNLGIPLEQSLKNMYKRVPNLDFKFFVTAVAIQRQAGGDLAEILDKIGHIVRERFKILGQVQALTGEGRISGIVLMALPIALFFAVWHLNEEYVMLLFSDEIGRKMVAVAAVLQVLGAVCIKKIIAIKV